jgi:hypothetical protein
MREGLRQYEKNPWASRATKQLLNNLVERCEALERPSTLETARVLILRPGQAAPFLAQRQLRVAAESPMGTLILEDVSTQSLFVDHALGQTLPWMRHFGTDMPRASRGAARFPHIPLHMPLVAGFPLDGLPATAHYLKGVSPSSAASFAQFIVSLRPYRLYTSTFGMVEQADQMLDHHTALVEDLQQLVNKLAGAIRQQQDTSQSIDWAQLHRRALDRLARVVIVDDNPDPLDAEGTAAPRNLGSDSVREAKIRENSYLRRPLDEVRREVTQAVLPGVMAAAVQAASKLPRSARTGRRNSKATVATPQNVELPAFTVNEIAALLDKRVSGGAARDAKREGVDGAMLQSMTAADLSHFFPSVDGKKHHRLILQVQREQKALIDDMTDPGRQHRPHRGHSKP